MKPFKTHEQQILILRDRGLTVDGPSAMRVLETEKYYNVINGYKDFFLQRDVNGNILQPEVYKAGATFDELYLLYKFDRELRNCLLEFLLKFETSLKSKISYRFSEKYKDTHAYLIHKNYSRNPSDLNTVLGVISTLSHTISKKRKTKTIEHYLDKHEGVPMWVLVNYLTIGNINHLYSCLKQPLRNQIAKDFATSYNSGYNVSIHFTPDMLDAINKLTNFYRNACAHEERLYNFKLTSPPRNASISANLNIPVSKLDKGNLFSMIAYLKLGLTNQEHTLLLKKFKRILDSYSSGFSTANFNDILVEMGFDSNWETYFSFNKLDTQKP